MSTNSTFLKEMGITEWTSRDLVQEKSEVIASVVATSTVVAETQERISSGIWWFFGNKPQGGFDMQAYPLVRAWIARVETDLNITD